MIPPAAGAAVMATGIVSVGLHLLGVDVLSAVFLVLDVALWVLLGLVFCGRLLRDRSRWEHDADTPAALTAVAATSVLGTRLTLEGWLTAGEVLLGAAVLLWPVLFVFVVRHWGPRMPGGVFITCVATQSIAVLGATLSAAAHVAWLGYAALVFFFGGLVVYAAAFVRFDLRQVLTGAGDHWVVGGALAISALAAARLVLAGRAGGLWNDENTDVLRFLAGLLLALDLTWYVVLCVAELVRPRLAYDVRRWSTVFPMGMTAVATLTVGVAVETGWLHGPGRVLVWIAVAAWLVTAAGALRSVGSARAAGATGALRSTGRR
nr:tellurite resistance/C4-dicarboxylate transporter family protein [Streptomyces sp. SID5785]